MAKPRVFISSTFYDLKQTRADLDNFITDLGYEAIRNEAGDIPYGKEHELQTYCYKEISNVDILVAIIGGRFGSPGDQEGYSVSQLEILTALEQNKHVYIFIENGVYNEYETFLANEDSTTIKYAFADNINIYKFIKEIKVKKANNVIQPFNSSNDIVAYLKNQWAGLFRDLISEANKRYEFFNLSKKVEELTELTNTLKIYLENVLKKIQPEESQSIIKTETKRLEEARKNIFKGIDYEDMIFQKIKSLSLISGVPPLTILHLFRTSRKIEDFEEKISKVAKKPIDRNTPIDGLKIITIMGYIKRPHYININTLQERILNNPDSN